MLCLGDADEFPAVQPTTWSPWVQDTCVVGDKWVGKSALLEQVGEEACRQKPNPVVFLAVY
jgi:hypothetical protein